MELIDIGANDLLTRPEQSIGPALARAAAKGVRTVVLLGNTVESSRTALRIATCDAHLQHGVELYCTAGVHPCEVMSWNHAAEEDLRALLEHPKCVAVGECGIDTHQRGRKKPPAIEMQEWVLKRQLRIAADVGKPLVLHDRGDGASGPLLAALRGVPSIPKARCVIHCVTTAQALALYLPLGFRVSLSGVVTYREKGLPVRHALKAAGPNVLDAVMLETDAPYHCPANVPQDELEAVLKTAPPPPVTQPPPQQQQAPVRVVPDSESSFLPHTAGVVADVCGVSCEELAARTTRNAAAFFNLNAVRAAVAAGEDPAKAERWEYQEGTEGEPSLSPRGTPPGSPLSDEAGPPALRFVVSVNLVKLCKLLRGIGVDTLQVQHSEAAMVRLAAKDHRIIVARHKKRLEKLIERNPHKERVQCVMLPSDNATEQVKFLIEKFRIAPLKSEVFKRCVACNACDWIKEPRGNCVGEVEENVLGAHEYFWRCGGCRKLFWEGGIYRRAKEHYSTLWSGAPPDEGGAPPPPPTPDAAAPPSDPWDAAAPPPRGPAGSGNNGCPRRKEGRPLLAPKPPRPAAFVDERQWRKEVHIIPVHLRHGVCLLECGQEWELPSSRVLQVGEDPRRRPLVAWDARERAAVKRTVLHELGVDLQDGDLWPARAAESGEPVEVGRRTYYMVILREHYKRVRGTDGARPPTTGEAYWLPSNRGFRFSPDKQQACQLIKYRRRPGAKVDVVGASALRMVAEKGYLRGRHARGTPPLQVPAPPKPGDPLAAPPAKAKPNGDPGAAGCHPSGAAGAKAHSSPKDSSPKDSSPKDSSPKDSSPKDSSPKDSSPKDSSPKERKGKQARRGAATLRPADVEAQAAIPATFFYEYEDMALRFAAQHPGAAAAAPAEEKEQPPAPPSKADRSTPPPPPPPKRKSLRQDGPVDIDALSAIPATFYYEYADMAFRFAAQDAVNESVVGLAALMPKLREKGVPAPDFARARWDWKPKWMQGTRCPEPVPHKLPLPLPLAQGTKGRHVEAVLQRFFAASAGDDHLLIAQVEKVRRDVEKAVLASPLGPQLIGVYVFGSAASGVALHQSLSDVDVCVRLSDPALRHVSSLADAGAGDAAGSPDTEDGDAEMELPPLEDASDVDDYEGLDDEPAAPAAASATHDRAAEARTLMVLSDAVVKQQLVRVSEHVFAARVPVLRGVLTAENLPIDLTVRFLGSVNTQLFRQYFERAPFLRPLSIVVKRWSSWTALRSSEKGWLTSYCVQLMLLYALVRTGTIPPIPLDEHQPVSAALKDAARPSYTGFASYTTGADHGTCLTEALGRFLRFYAWDFDWERDVVCLRSAAAAVPKAGLPGMHWDSAVAVRDPFEANLNLTKNVTRKIFTEIRRKFRLSYGALADGSIASAFM